MRSEILLKVGPSTRPRRCPVSAGNLQALTFPSMGHPAFVTENTITPEYGKIGDVMSSNEPLARSVRANGQIGRQSATTMMQINVSERYAFY
jgi:hypothetical protein